MARLQPPVGSGHRGGLAQRVDQALGGWFGVQRRLCRAAQHEEAQDREARQVRISSINAARVAGPALIAGAAAKPTASRKNTTAAAISGSVRPNRPVLAVLAL